MQSPPQNSTADLSVHLQRSELARSALALAALVSFIVVGLLRRAMGGKVVSANAVFLLGLAVTCGGVLYYLFMVWEIRRSERRGFLMPRWRWWLGATVDLLIPAALLLILQISSPLGFESSLSAPSLLMFPLVIMLSTLRLDTRYSLSVGLGAAVIHWALVGLAITAADIDGSRLPFLFSYGIMLAIMGVAASVIASRCRRYVHSAVSEAMAGERDRLALATVQRDLAVARDIQMGLMPRSAPSLAGFDIAGMARPAEQTGGDFYDWQPLPDGRLAVAMADVTGHGIGPALVMAVCRAYSRAAAPEAPDPGALLERLNALLQDDLPAGRFITMAIALLHSDGTVDLGSAGHGPTLLYRAASGQVQVFGGDGIPLGLVPLEQYSPHQTFTMSSGDVLVLLTDGFMEWAREDGQQFGVERLQSALSKHAGEPAASVITSMDQAVRGFANGSPQPDDMTIVVIRRL